VRAELIRLKSPRELFSNTAISVQCRFARSGLPVGLQIIAGPRADFKLPSIASTLEQESGIRLLRMLSGHALEKSD
jgi:Asp-tRNA(Asn)/Glu-tRNA(Gln) amidotransferase A subunit family amidase